MLELQQAIYNAMKEDPELLALLDFDLSAVIEESEVSKRLLPAPPLSPPEDTFIMFWQPLSHKSRRNYLFENRNIQFRIYAKDESLIQQQRICERLKYIFVGDEYGGGRVFVERQKGFEDIEYVGDGQMPGISTDGHYAWYLELIFQNVVKYNR